MKPRVLAIFALFLLIPGVLVFAGGSREDRPKTITVALKNDTRADALRAIFDLFEEETGHIVEIQALPSGEEFGRLMQTRFATNDYPDVFEMDPGSKQYTKFRASETLYDWTDDPVIDTITESTLEFQTLDGKIYGIPWDSTNFLGAFYNKEVFRQAGVSVPRSYSEFLDVLNTLADLGFIPIYEAINTEWPTQVFSLDGWTTFVDETIDDSDVDDLEENRLRMTEIPALRDVLERQYAIFTQGLLQNNALAGTYDNQQEQFGQNRVGIVFQGAWFLGAMEQKFGRDFVQDNIGWFPLPHDDGPGYATLYPAKQFLVPRLTDNVAESVELVRFMTRPENLAIWYDANPGIPVYQGVAANLYNAQAEAREYIESGNARINIQNRLSSSFTDYPKILQNMYINGDIDGAIQQLDENYRRTGRARNLPGF